MCTMGSRPPGMGRSQPLSLRSPGDTNRDGEGEARGSSAGAQKKVRGAGRRGLGGGQGLMCAECLFLRMWMLTFAVSTWCG